MQKVFFFGGGGSDNWKSEQRRALESHMLNSVPNPHPTSSYGLPAWEDQWLASTLFPDTEGTSWVCNRW